MAELRSIRKTFKMSYPDSKPHPYYRRSVEQTPSGIVLHMELGDRVILNLAREDKVVDQINGTIVALFRGVIWMSRFAYFNDEKDLQEKDGRKHIITEKINSSIWDRIVFVSRGYDLDPPPLHT